MVNKKLFEFGYPVYPCVYREHLISGNLPYVIVGLSLCVQGTLYPKTEKALLGRFIPVCTGNIIGVSHQIYDPSVYPCVYREHAKHKFNPTYFLRFIPVCTGNILALPIMISANPVYPCVYREH